MLTRQEAERLAQAVNALRPDWPVTSLLTFVHKRKERPLLDLSLELTYVALDPDTKSPARIDQAGPWKQLANPVGKPPEYRVSLPTDCGICSRPFEFHSRLSAVDDHDYTAASDRSEGVRPTSEQRAAIDKAIADAQLERTAAKEAAEAREPKTVDEVLANHTPTARRPASVTSTTEATAADDEGNQ